MNQKMNIDLSEIINMAKLKNPNNSTQRDKIIKVLKQVGYKLVEHVFTQYPTPPVDWGNLRGGFNVIVDKKAEKIPANMFSSVQGKQGRKHEPDEEPPFMGDMNEYMVRVFNGMPYAVYMHEGMSPEGTEYEPGETSKQAGNVGGGFLSRKVLDKENIAEYKEILGKPF